MKRSRFRLIFAISLITIYMLSALVWWAFALTRNQEKIYQKELALVNIQMEWAKDYAYHFIKTHPIQSLSNVSIVSLNQERLQVDTSRLKSALEKKFPEIHVNYMTNGQRGEIELCLYVDEVIQSELEQTLFSKKRAWVLEGITLGVITLVIAAGMFFYVDKIIRLNAQQNNFLLAVTHELKTPIAATKLALQTLQKNTQAALNGRLIQMGNSNILRLSRMVDQILLSTKFESKFIDPVFAPIELHALIESAIEGLELPSESKDLLELKLNTRLTIHADESMMLMVIRNLITNALKYGDGNPITISSDLEGSQIKLCISDLGIGISDSDKKRIFDKFYRVGEEKTRTQPGSGLGLYLVKKITEIHGGKVEVTNNQPQGTKFTLTLNNISPNI